MNSLTWPNRTGVVLILVLQPLLPKPFQDATTDKNRNGQRWTRQGERFICN